MRTMSILHGYTVFASLSGPATLRSTPNGDLLNLPDPTPLASYLINVQGSPPPVGTPVITANVYAHVAEVFRHAGEPGNMVRVDVGTWRP